MISSYGATEFSHKRHVRLKLPCAFCHTGALTKERAEFPAVSVCRGCHPSMDVKPFPANRVYTVADFVFFSHSKHAQAGVKCKECHGDVAASDVITAETKMNMMWCVNCHKTAHAPVTCTACHELSQ